MSDGYQIVISDSYISDSYISDTHILRTSYRRYRAWVKACRPFDPRKLGGDPPPGGPRGGVNSTARLIVESSNADRHSIPQLSSRVGG